jgi:hypothetical protein
MAENDFSQDWIDDCMEFYGSVLTGKKSHWCPEWDDLPIDETCSEFNACCCMFDDEQDTTETSAYTSTRI